jgi:hypothetical protein
MVYENVKTVWFVHFEFKILGTCRAVIDHKHQGSVWLGKDLVHVLLMHLASLYNALRIVPSIHTVECFTGEASAASMAGKSVCRVCEPPAAYDNCQRHSRP